MRTHGLLGVLERFTPYCITLARLTLTHTNTSIREEVFTLVHENVRAPTRRLSLSLRKTTEQEFCKRAREGAQQGVG